MIQHKIFRYGADGQLLIHRENANSPNGMAMDSQKNLVICEQSAGRIVRMEKNGEVTVLADQYEGKKFNSPNDVWISKKGEVYFTDPAWGPSAPQPPAIYRITKNGKVQRLATDFVNPIVRGHSLNSFLHNVNSACVPG